MLPPDSILTHPQLSPLAQSDYYASGDSVADVYAVGQLRGLTDADNVWVVLTMVFLLGLIALIMVPNREHLLFRVKEFFSTERRFSSEHMVATSTEAVHLTMLLAIGLASLAVIYHSFLMTMPLADHLPDVAGIGYALLWAAGAAFLLSKVVAYSLINWVFFDRTRNRKWTFAFFFLTAIFSCAVFVVAVLYQFADLSFEIVTKCMLFLLISYELLLFFRLITNFSPKKYGVLLIFLYFCSVELVPILVTWHFFAQLTATNT